MDFLKNIFAHPGLESAAKTMEGVNKKPGEANKKKAAQALGNMLKKKKKAPVDVYSFNK